MDDCQMNLHKDGLLNKGSADVEQKYTDSKVEGIIRDTMGLEILSFVEPKDTNVYTSEGGKGALTNVTMEDVCTEVNMYITSESTVSEQNELASFSSSKCVKSSLFGTTGEASARTSVMVEDDFDTPADESGHGQDCDAKIISNVESSSERKSVTVEHDKARSTIESNGLGCCIDDANIERSMQNGIICKENVADRLPVSANFIASISGISNHAKITEGEVKSVTVMEQGELRACLTEAVSANESSDLLNSVEQPLHEHKSSAEFHRNKFPTDTHWEDNDAMLREHWTRTLQSSTSTGEVVEEIVRVLNKQKTHDLLCPVCGSCITRRVILRKRKRVSITSERWNEEQLEVGDSSSVSVSSIDSIKGQLEDVEERERAFFPVEDSETDAYGCLQCCSFFFRKFVSIRHSPQEDMQEEDVDKWGFRCLPFFFPPYPWGMSSIKPRSSETAGQRAGKPGMPVIVDNQDSRVDEIATRIRQGQDVVAQQKFKVTRGLSPIFIPDYPWGAFSDLETKEALILEVNGSGVEENVENQEIKEDVAVGGVQKGQVSVVQQHLDFINGISPVILPDYSWGVFSDASIEDGVKGKEHDVIKESDEYITEEITGNFSETTELSDSRVMTLNEDDSKEKLLSRPKGAVTVDESTNVADAALSSNHLEKKHMDQERGRAYEASSVSEKERIVKVNQKSFRWHRRIFHWLPGEASDSDMLKRPLLEVPEESDAINEGTSKGRVLFSLKWFVNSRLRMPTDKSKDILPISLPVAPGLEQPTPGMQPPVLDYSKELPGRADSAIQIDSRGTVDFTEALPAMATAIEPAGEQESEGWEIVRCIVHGGLDISIASFAVVSSAAGGDANTRTVVYMGLATLVSGIIAFYHNIVNTFHNHRDHYTATVGKSLSLHGTLAVLSYFFFGILAPVTYAFTFRETDNKDYKFAATCGASAVGIILLSLGKAYLTNRSYIKTVGTYISTGVVSSLVGYLTGKHVSKLLEKWGFKDSNNENEG